MPWFNLYLLGCLVGVFVEVGDKFSVSADQLSGAVFNKINARPGGPVGAFIIFYGEIFSFLPQ